MPLTPNDFADLIDTLGRTERRRDIEARFDERLAILAAFSARGPDAPIARFLAAHRLQIGRAGAVALVTAAEAEPPESEIGRAARTWRETHALTRLEPLALQRAPDRDRRLARLETAHGGGIGVLALDSLTRAMVAIDGGTAFRFDLDSGRTERHELKGYHTVLRSARLGPHHAIAHHAASDGSEDGGAIHVWDLRTLRPKRLWKVGGEVLALAGSPDGTVAAFGTERGARWAPVGESRTREVRTDFPVGALAFAPDGRTLAVGCADGLLRLVRVEGVPDGEPLGGPRPRGTHGAAPTRRLTTTPWELGGEAGPVAITSLAFSADGTRLLVAGFANEWDPVVELWDVPTRTRVVTVAQELPGSQGVSVPHVAVFGPGEQTVYAFHRSEYLEVWDLAGASRAGTIHMGHRDIGGLVSLAQGELATIDSCGVELWDVSAPDTEPYCPSDRDYPSMSPPIFAQDGHVVLTPRAGSVGVWEVATGRCQRTLQVPNGRADFAVTPKVVPAPTGPHALVFHPMRDPYDDDRRGDGVDRRVRVWNTTATVTRLVPDLGPILSAAIGPDGLVAAAIDAVGVRVFRLDDPRSGTRVLPLGAPKLDPWTSRVSFVGPTRLLVETGPNARVVDLADGRVVATHTDRASWDESAVRAPVPGSDQWLRATSTGVRTVLIRDLLSGEAVCKLTVPRAEYGDNEIEWVRFAGADRVLVSDSDRTLHGFALPSGEPVFGRRSADIEGGGGGLVVMPAPERAWGIGSVGDVLWYWDFADGTSVPAGVTEGQVLEVAISANDTVAVETARESSFHALRVAPRSVKPPGEAPEIGALDLPETGALAQAIAALRAGTIRVVEPSERTELPEPERAEPGVREAWAMIAQSDEDEHVLDEEALLKKAEKRLEAVTFAEGVTPSAAYLQAIGKLGERLVEQIEEPLQRRAKKWLERGAALGDMEARYALACAYANGDLSTKDRTLERRLFEEVAAAGLPWAAYDLATDLIDEGETERGYELVARAALAGHAPAICHLGEQLRTGVHGAADPATARLAFSLVAEDDENAAAELAILWKTGVGGPADAGEAERWYQRSRANGYDWRADRRWRKASA